LKQHNWMAPITFKNYVARVKVIFKEAGKPQNASHEKRVLARSCKIRVRTVIYIGLHLPDMDICKIHLQPYFTAPVIHWHKFCTLYYMFTNQMLLFIHLDTAGRV
jgi:hypothetical protein